MEGRNFQTSKRLCPARETLGEIPRGRVPSDEENGVEIGETGEMGASGGKRKFEKVVGEKGAVRRRERRDGLDEVKDRFGVVEHRDWG